MKLFGSLIFSFLILFPASPKKIVLKLGTAECYVHIYRGKANPIPVIRIHGDENTCISAFFDLPVSTPITLYQLSKRLLEFKEKNKPYFFDPNRMFSRKGIIESLEKYNTGYPRHLVSKILSFSRKILNIGHFNHPGKEVVAIHNNTNGAFSVRTYRHFSEAAKIFVSSRNDPDDFFIVTLLKDFDFFKKHHQNVVLQSNNARDDGSLSVYCAQHSIRYINVEAQHGHVQKQKQMLLLCRRLLSGY